MKKGRKMKWKIKLNFPFDWRLKLKFAILPERPTPCIIKDKKWIRAIELSHKKVPVIVEAGEKAIVFHSTHLKERERREVENIVKKLLGIEDTTKLYEFMESDEVLKRIKKRLHGFGRAGLMAASVYEGVVKAITQQQISLRVAEHIIANLVEKFGSKFSFMNEYAYDFPSPTKLASASLQQLRKCGLSRRKAEYIKEFSQAVVEGFNVEKLKDRKPDEIMETLCSFKGIGRWTAELVMIATIGLNVIPADDLGIRKAISHFYFNDELQSPQVIRKFAEERFSEHMRDAVIYLLMAYRMGL